MMEAPAKFFVDAVNDSTLFLLDSKNVGISYLLYGEKYGDLFHIQLVSVYESVRRYLIFDTDLWSCQMYASNLTDLLFDIAGSINNSDVIITNPYALVLSYGGNLLGSECKMPEGYASDQPLN
jgi:hypothetical protein